MSKNNWKKYTLKNLVSFQTGKLNSNAAIPNGEYPFFTCSQEIYKTNTYSFDCECCLLGGNNANATYPLFYYNGKFDAYQRTYIIQSLDKNKISNKYLYYSLRLMLDLLKSISTGAATKFLTITILNNLEITIPDIITQEKIAKILSNYDDLIENNNKRIKILEEMVQKIYKEWFIDFKFPGHETTTFKDSELGKIPKGWTIEKVSNISKLSKGKSYKSSELVDNNSGLPFLNLKCIERDGGFKREGLKWFVGKYNDSHIVLPEDIIMAVTDMTQERRLVARPARIPHNWFNKYIMSMDLVKLMPNIDINKTYFYCLLKYSKFSDEVKNHANGANVLHLNPQNIENFELVIAKKETRELFGKIVKNIYNEIDLLNLKNEKLKQSRDILLPRLISGEVDVEDLEIK